MDNRFENFKGFHPEGEYETFYEKNPTQTAIEILKMYKGKEVEIGYDRITKDQGIKDEEHQLTVPEDDNSIEQLFTGIETDRIYIISVKNEFPNYIIQRIKSGNQEISEVDRRKRE